MSETRVNPLPIYSRPAAARVPGSCGSGSLALGVCWEWGASAGCVTPEGRSGARVHVNADRRPSDAAVAGRVVSGRESQREALIDG